MRRRFRIAALLFCGLLLVAGIVLLTIYLASRHVPAAYRRALAADPVSQKKASDQMVRKATALASNAETTGKWHARFTTEQINGWFAVDMRKNHPDLLPAGLSDPRVAISPEQMTLFCRFQRGRINSVVSLSLDVYLAEPDLLAVRLRRARAGALPMPLGKVLEHVSKEARHQRLPLTWKRVQGDPVALIRLDLRRGEEQEAMRIEAIELGKDEIVVTGTAE